MKLFFACCVRFKTNFYVKSSQELIRFCRNIIMGKDIFIIDTRCHLNRSITKAFEKKGYEVKVSILGQKTVQTTFFRNFQHFAILCLQLITCNWVFSGCYRISWCPGWGSQASGWVQSSVYLCQQENFKRTSWNLES